MALELNVQGANSILIDILNCTPLKSEIWTKLIKPTLIKAKKYAFGAKTLPRYKILIR